MNVTVLVDFENDSVRTSLEVAEALGDHLWGVRLDTSGQLVDRALWDEMGDFAPTGVNPVLVERVREALDERRPRARADRRVGWLRRGAHRRVRAARRAGRRLRGRVGAAAGLERLHGRHRRRGRAQPCAKVGRRFRPNPRLERVD